MQKVLLAGLGGFIGSAARYSLSVALVRTSAALSFPIATLLVNVLGSFLIGFLLGTSAGRGWLGDDARVFVIVGVLGGFTTFSSFSNDTLLLLREGLLGRASANIILNVTICLLAVWIGDVAGRALGR